MDTKGAKSKNQVGARVVALPGVDRRLSAELALRAAIDTNAFSTLRDLESLDGGRAVQSVYVALIRRLPNVVPDRKRIAVDTGFSESSVKRAIKLLETCSLVTVERRKGRSSTYHLADLRVRETANECLTAIRKLCRSTARSPASRSRVASELTRGGTRATTDRAGPVTVGQRVGPQVAQKGSMKNQSKQQRVVCDRDGKEETLNETLRRWGIESASYLAKPGHPKANPILANNPGLAPRLIDLTMARVRWSDDAGVGARVTHLREKVAESMASIEHERHNRERRRNEVADRAARVAAELPEYDAVDPSVLERRRFETLLRRGLNRLDESADVSAILARDEIVQGRIVTDEFVREQLKRRIESMSEEVFASNCQRLFASMPGLHVLYEPGDMSSVGLRLTLLEFLRKDAVLNQSVLDSGCDDSTEVF